MLDVDHLDIDPSDIMVFIYQSGRRLVESGQNLHLKEQQVCPNPSWHFRFVIRKKNSCVKERKLNCLRLKTEDKKTDIAILFEYDT